MHFYDAELLRLRAHTVADPVARHADLNAARDLARRQGAALFELRATLDHVDLRGPEARAVLSEAVARVPADGGCPELERAKAHLGL